MPLTWNDWKDPIALRERLAEIHAEAFIPLRIARVEREIVRTLCRLTGLSADEIRSCARADAEAVAAAEAAEAAYAA